MQPTFVVQLLQGLTFVLLSNHNIKNLLYTIPLIDIIYIPLLYWIFGEKNGNLASSVALLYQGMIN